MSNITILSTEIRQHNGLFSINDLHKASGGAQKHQPRYWLANQQTKELIAEIQNSGIPLIKVTRGSQGGTYACRELVIAYAAWISAAFHLKVIRVFLDTQTQQSQYYPMIPADKPNLSNTRWRLHFDDEGRPNMSIIPDGALMCDKSGLLEYVRHTGEASPFDVDYVQKLAVACIHRLDKEVHVWKGEMNRAYSHLRSANEKIKQLEA